MGHLTQQLSSSDTPDWAPLVNGSHKAMRGTEAGNEEETQIKYMGTRVAEWMQSPACYQKGSSCQYHDCVVYDNWSSILKPFVFTPALNNLKLLQQSLTCPHQGA